MTSRADNSADRDTRRAAVRVALLLAGFAVIVAVVLALPGVDDVRQRFAATRPGWVAVIACCSLASMFGFVRALWAAFDRLVPWRQAVILGFAEQAANVLLPAGGLRGGGRRGGGAGRGGGGGGRAGAGGAGHAAGGRAGSVRGRAPCRPVPLHQLRQLRRALPRGDAGSGRRAARRRVAGRVRDPGSRRRGRDAGRRRLRVQRRAAGLGAGPRA